MTVADAAFPEPDDDVGAPVPRDPAIERWLLTTALRGITTTGMRNGFADEVIARLDQHGPDVRPDLTREAILHEIEEEALDMAGWLLLLNYVQDDEPFEPHLHRLLGIVQAASTGFFTTRRMRLWGPEA